MDDHGPVLQERVESLPVGGDEGGRRAVGRDPDQLVERVGQKEVEGQEEGEVDHQHDHDPGHHVPAAAAVLNNGKAGEKGGEKHPQQHRPVMSPPDGRDLVQERERPAAVVGHVGGGEIVRQHEVEESAEGQDRGGRGGQGRPLPARRHPPLAQGDSGQRGNDGVEREAKGQEKGESSEVGHGVPEVRRFARRTPLRISKRTSPRSARLRRRRRVRRFLPPGPSIPPGRCRG